MPIRNTRQDWSIGRTVKVGFMSLEVIAYIPTPGDWAPDIYVLESGNGRRYEFTPHMGLQRID